MSGADSAVSSENRPGLPESDRASWRRVYSTTHYRKLPWFSSSAYPWVREAVESKLVRRGGRVLDVGCGAGTNSLFLARSGFRVSGVDLAPAAISAAQSRASRQDLSVDFRVADALRLPFGSKEFDGLVDVGCFHTIPIRLRRAYSKELARVTRPGGRYVLAWIGRESGQEFGPPHRPSLEEAAATFEEEFLFLRSRYSAPRGGPFSEYHALLERRARPRPAPR
jgi:SAM-dependent methyltransferase